MFKRQVKVQKMEKYFNYINYKRKMPTLERIEHFSIYWFLADCVFCIFRLKMYRLDPTEMDTKISIPAPPQIKLIKTRSNILHKWKINSQNFHHLGSENKINTLNSSIIHVQVRGECILNH